MHLANSTVTNAFVKVSFIWCTSCPIWFQELLFCLFFRSQVMPAIIFLKFILKTRSTASFKSIGTFTGYPQLVCKIWWLGKNIKPSLLPFSFSPEPMIWPWVLPTRVQNLVEIGWKSPSTRGAYSTYSSRISSSLSSYLFLESVLRFNLQVKSTV